MSGIGQGINTEDPKKPQQSGLYVLPDVNNLNVELVDITRGVEEVISTRPIQDATAYVGWSESAIANSRPLPLKPVSYTEPCGGVIASYALSMCRASFMGAFRPSSTLQRAVRTALDTPDQSRRASQLSEVFRQFGHVCATSVEMGGIKYVTALFNGSRQVR